MNIVRRLLAKVRGVSIPSETCDRSVPVRGLDDWRAVAESAATFPVIFATGEHGEPVTRARLSTVSGPIGESGTDEDLNLDSGVVMHGTGRDRHGVVPDNEIVAGPQRSTTPPLGWDF